MPETTSPEMRSFQSEVLREYRSLKTLKRPLPDDFAESFASESRRRGCLGLLFGAAFPPLMGRLDKYARRTHSEAPENVRYSIDSKEILSNPAIRSILCPSISENISPDRLVEEREIELVKILTTSLTAKTVAPETWQKFNSRLYAYMLDYILEVGPENYCAVSENGE
jgi:hypothetical protein